ncbi:dehydrogenase [Leptolyngbya valderiana BDU 20041]|nr:dehydrogenase [Leptolyngbya valderiana BDU 20041]
MTMRAVSIALLASLVLTGCGAGERLSGLNPFRGEETDDPNAPAAADRVSVLELEERLSSNLEQGPVRLPRAYVNRAWPQPDGYATHAMQHTNASGPLARAWRERAGEGSNRDRRLNARPVIAEGVVFAVDAEGRVSARALETGAEQWRIRLDEDRREAGDDSWIPFVGGGDRVLTFGGGVAYDSGRIYAHAGGMTLFALDAATGEEVWRTTALTPLHAAPTAVDGRVFVTTDDNELLAVDADDGDILWTHRSIAETARLLTAPSPAVAGEVVIAPFTSGEIVALRVQNGAVLWSDSLTRTGGLTPLSSINDIAASPVVLGDRVYAMSHSGIMAAFDLRSGERVWTLPAGGLHAPYLAGDYLFLVTTEAEVAAIDRDAGQVRWITQLPAFENERRRRDRISWAGPILAGGRLLLASSQGEMVILDPATGERTEDRDIGAPVYIAPVIADETVVVFTDEGRLIAYR